MFLVVNEVAVLPIYFVIDIMQFQRNEYVKKIFTKG